MKQMKIDWTPWTDRLTDWAGFPISLFCFFYKRVLVIWPSVDDFWSLILLTLHPLQASVSFCFLLVWLFLVWSLRFECSRYFRLCLSFFLNQNYTKWVTVFGFVWAVALSPNSWLNPLIFCFGTLKLCLLEKSHTLPQILKSKLFSFSIKFLSSLVTDTFNFIFN